ncbi:RagB/SusD family nutrient uptake outer membrane protein [Mucilaginibacter lacusdianchii]|uniref:RagB/SusD family nutrient uptake outer membrane protein n=1 Tax=Mucilaginibacter lacusdianchii TaxID=2684211 RepID=UPI00131B3C8C|nr:RagB/SusD family nutrient uptake outer membrane protein [Mucilaginibacter sp. JXJ CY 39]
MKKYISILIVAMLTSATSCKKFLEQVPDDRLTLDETFSNRATALRFLNNVYSLIPDEFGQRNPDVSKSAGLWTAGSDEAEYVWGFAQTNNLNIGSWDANSGFVNDYWNNFYRGIRSASFFMANIDKVNQDISPEEKVKFKNEARALRAIYYFYLMRLYGPVVILGEDVIEPDAPSESVRLPRNSFDECVDYVASELQNAANNLPVTNNGDNNYGRINKGMALSYRLQTYLLAASPLYNGNADLANLKNKDGKQLVNQSFDATKWKRAADAYKAYIDQFVPNTYSLFRKNNSSGVFDPYLSCRDIFLDKFNNEIIMSRLDASIEGRQYEMTPYHSGKPSEVRGSAGLGATQNQVDAFFTANGRSIDDPASGYQTAGFTDYQAPGSPIATNTFNQWVNREPRFYVNITYHNSVWLNTSFGNIITEFTANGNSGKATGGNDYTVTGYAVRKAMGLGNWRESNRPVILYRVGNLFLDYAEALNESNPGDPDILKYLNQIRERAGIPQYGTGTNALPVPATKEAMRDAIRKERRSELAFENVRFFDTRRWKIAETTDNGPIYGLNITKNAPEFFTVIPFETRVFTKRHYLFPIPSKDVNADNLMVQNPGW